MHATFFVVYYSCFSVRNDTTYAPLRDEIRKWLWFQTSSRWFHVDWRSRYRFEKSWCGASSSLDSATVTRRTKKNLIEVISCHISLLSVSVLTSHLLGISVRRKRTEHFWAESTLARGIQRSNQFPNYIHQKCRKWFSLCFRSLRLTLELPQILFICSVVLRELWPS